MKIIIILLLLNLSLFSAESSENNIEGSEVAETIKDEQKPPAFVKVSNVPENAVKMTIKLKNIQEELKKEVTQNKKMHETIHPYCNSISLLLASPPYQNIAKRDLGELRKMQSEQSVHLQQLNEWDGKLKSSLKIYDKNRELLEGYSALWSQTHINAVAKNAPEAILDHIASVITDTEELENSLKTEYDKTLTDSQVVSTKILTIEELGATLEKSRTLVKNQVFQNKAPLLTLFSQAEFSLFGYLSSINHAMVEKYKQVIIYFQTHTDLFLNFFILTLLSMAFVSYFNYLYRKGKLFLNEESVYKKMFFFIGRPFSTFIILFALAIIAIFPDRPPSLRDIIFLALIIPVTRILQTTIEKRYYKYIYIILALFAMRLMTRNAMGYELENRIFMLLINVALFITIGSILTKKILYTINYNFITKIGNYLLVFFLLLLLVAFGANLYGSVLFSTRLIDGVFLTLYASMSFYVMYTILSAYVVLIQRRRIATASNMLEKYSKNIENTTKLLIKIWMFSWWSFIVMKVLGIYPYLVTLTNNTLALSWQVAEITISVQSIFDFIFIVIATWLLARIIRTVLEVEVFARFTLPRGVPTAIVTVLNYIIIISGTIIAFSSLGVSVQQFTLIFGALGVGIGFGLRNIIANFVSGIIMVFERPVQIGDTIEMDKTMGSVLSIGARSSTIKTFDGAEVIIPNADFIAKEITNWTLSDEHRRKIINFKVAFGSDIELVIKIMKEVVSAHPDVLKDPEPMAVFQGFGEYYLEFKVYFWLSDNLIQAQSDISIGIYKELIEAGVKMPVPKSNLTYDL